MGSQVLNQISFSKETVWGTEVVPAKSVEVKFSGGMATDNATKYIEGMKSVIAKEHGSMIGARKHSGDYQMDLFTDYPGYFILSALGAVNSALHAGETTVYDHTITEQETKPSLTIEQAYGSDVSRFQGSIVSDLKFTIKTGEYATLDAKLLAKSRTVGNTKVAGAFRNEPAFSFNQFAVKIGGTQVTEVISAELEYKNNLQFLPALNNSNDVAFNYIKASEVTGKIELYLDTTSYTQLTNYLSGTDVSVEIIGTGGAIGSAAHYGIDILVPVCAYEKEDQKLQDGYNLVTLDLKGKYDTSTAQLIKIVLTNLLTAYN